MVVVDIATMPITMVPSIISWPHVDHRAAGSIIRSWAIIGAVVRTVITPADANAYCNASIGLTGKTNHGKQGYKREKFYRFHNVLSVSEDRMDQVFIFKVA
jgi:hypothetical protein